MMTAEKNTLTAPYLAEYTHVKHQLPGNNIDWITQLRSKALSEFANAGFPTQRQEDWKYTALTPLIKQHFPICVNESDTHLSEQQINQLACLKENYFTLVFVNGQLQRLFHHDIKLPAGLTIKSLASIMQHEPDILKPHLAKYATAQLHGIAALNLAFIQDGSYIEVAENIKIDKPLQLLFINTKTVTPQATPIRNLILVGANSQVNIIEHYIGLDETANFTNIITEIVADPHSHIQHFKLQQETTKTIHIGTTHIQQAAHSHVSSYSFSFGGSLVRSDTQVKLAGEHASCELLGLYLTRGKQHVDHHTFIDHQHPHTKSQEFYKGILQDRSRAVFNGKVFVQQQAQHTDAKQNNNNLLLSEDAEIDTKPQLQIYADDVKCTHGATVGQLDDQELFYLRSRGIALEAARSLLIYAFANEVLTHIKLPEIQQQLQMILKAWL